MRITALRNRQDQEDKIIGETLKSFIDPEKKILEFNSSIIRDDLKKITKQVLNSNQKTILLAIYNNQNQRRYIGIKLD